MSCPAAGSCVAVGEYTTTSGTEAGLIETLAGGTWTASGAPVPAGAGGPGRAFLASVSCATASSCSAVGSARSAGGDTTTPLWVSLGPGGWTATSVPSVPGTQATSFLVGVSCPGAGTCVAVGSAADGTGGAVPVVVTETAAGMDSQLAPLPAAADRAASGNHLVAVACGAPATCVAVGAYVDASGTGWALAVDGRGASWSDAALPLPPGEFSTGGVLESDLVAVACGGPASCVAVGSYWSPAGQLSPLAVSSAGSGWGLDAVAIPTAPPTSRPAAGTPATATAAASTTAPTGAATTSAATGTVGTAATGNAWGGALQAVACASAGRCTAVGQYWKAGGGSGAMAQSLATGSWSASGGPSPAQATPTAGGASWSSVACVATSCTAVGDYLAATGAALGVLSSSV